MASMELTLRELSNRVGIEPRTIRSYIEKGLLPGPEGAGRSAAYSERHLNRLQIIKVRKDHQGWALEHIRRQLLGMTELEIRELAEALGAEEQVWTKRLDELPASPLEYVKAVQAQRAGEAELTVPASTGFGIEPGTVAGRAALQLFAERGPEQLRRTSLADRIRRVDQQTREEQKPERRGLFGWLGDGDDLAAQSMMAFAASSSPPSSRSPRSPKAKLSYEIEVTPDVSLIVKGLSADNEFAELKLRRFELMAERLRELLSSPPEDIDEFVKRLKDLG